MLLLTGTGVLAQDRPPVVELQTNLGTIAVRLDYANAPITADNFIDYVNTGFYRNTLIHRVVKDFVIQGGGMDRATGQFKTTNPPIVNEASNGLGNLTGTIAMARTSNPDSATSQFFINLVDNTGLDYGSVNNPAGYAVFGRVIKGMAIVNQIGKLPTIAQLPHTGESTLVWIDAVHTNKSWKGSVSRTRITRSGAGSVSSVPEGIACGTQCSMSQTAGASLTLIATPGKNTVFIGWRGDCSGARRTIDIDTSAGNHNCTAVFAGKGPAIQ